MRHVQCIQPKQILNIQLNFKKNYFDNGLRLQGIHLNQDETSSEHFYDNIDSETSDFEKQTILYRNRSTPWYEKRNNNEQFDLV